MSFKVTCVVFDISLLYFLRGKMSFDFSFDLICYCSIIEYCMDVNYDGKEFTKFILFQNIKYMRNRCFNR